MTRCVGVIAALRWASTLGRSPFGLAFRQYIRPQPKTLSLGPSSSTPSARGRQAVVFVWFRIGRLTLSTSSPTRRLGVVLPRRLNRFAGGEIRSSCIAERREEAANQIFDQEGASHGGGSFPSIFGEKDGARTPARGLHGCARSGPGASSVTQPPTGYDVLPSIKGSPKPIINFFTRFTFFSSSKGGWMWNNSGWARPAQQGFDVWRQSWHARRRVRIIALCTSADFIASTRPILVLLVPLPRRLPAKLYVSADLTARALSFSFIFPPRL